MKHALVKVHAYAPFPRTFTGQFQGSSWSVIAARAARAGLKNFNMRRLDKKQPISLTIQPL